MDQAALEQAARWLREARRVVVFTGAGVSAGSGIPTFRDSAGFWREFPPEAFARWGGLRETARRDPERVARFLRRLLEPIAEARPNPAHQAIAELEARLHVTVVTQNVDHLHQEAGSARVRELHGSMLRVVSVRGGGLLDQLDRAQLGRVARRLACLERGPFKLARLLWAARPLIGVGLLGGYRPDLVLFGDPMAEPAWSDAVDDVMGCDLMLIVGTSGLVYPAASLPELAHERGARLIQVDPSDPGLGDVCLDAPAERALPQLIARAWPGRDAPTRRARA